MIVRQSTEYIRLLDSEYRTKKIVNLNLFPLLTNTIYIAKSKVVRSPANPKMRSHQHWNNS